jgi:hypothetical protein
MSAADKEIPHKKPMVFTLTEGRLELLTINVYLFCILHWVTYISLQHSWKTGVTKN